MEKSVETIREVPYMRPHTLMLIPSMACQACCSYCFGPHDGGQMQQETVDAAVQFMRKPWSEGSGYHVLLHGGEPLLAGIDLITYIFEMFRKQFHHRVRFSMQSNLWLLTQPLVDLLAQYCVSVSTSIDGNRELCDSQRGDGYFDKTMAGIRLLQENGLKVSAIATLTPAYTAKVPEIIDFFVREELPFTLRGAVPSLQNGNLRSDLYCSSGDMKSVFDQTLAYLQSHPEATRIRDVEAVVQNVFTGHSSLCTFSNCIGHYLAVAPDGGLFTCQRFCGEPAFQVGDVHLTRNMHDIEQSDAYRRIVQASQKAHQDCTGCPHLPYCNSGCVYSLLVCEKYSMPKPFCNTAEYPNNAYRQVFNSVSIKLAMEQSDALIGKENTSPLLSMVGERPHPADIRKCNRDIREAYAWGRYGAPMHAFANRNRVEKLFLNITDYCPLRCTHCSVDAGDGHTVMPMDTTLTVIQQAVNIGYKEISINGGEPFTYPWFSPLLCEMKNLHHHPSRFVLFTNLYCDMDVSLVQLVREAFDQIIVSLDGDKAAHDLRRGQGSFDKTYANLRTLCNSPGQCKISLRATLTEAEKAMGLGERVQEIGETLGIHSVYIKNVFPIGRACHMQASWHITPVDAAPYITRNAFRPRNTCGIGSSLHITPSGDVYPCWGLIGHIEPMGNVRDGLAFVTNGYRSERESPFSVDNLEKCQNCDVRYICGGVCVSLAGADCTAHREALVKLAQLACEA